jgi:hypothetical protein
MTPTVPAARARARRAKVRNFLADNFIGTTLMRGFYRRSNLDDFQTAVVTRSG